MEPLDAGIFHEAMEDDWFMAPIASSPSLPGDVFSDAMVSTGMKVSAKWQIRVGDKWAELPERLQQVAEASYRMDKTFVGVEPTSAELHVLGISAPDRTSKWRLTFKSNLGLPNLWFLKERSVEKHELRRADDLDGFVMNTFNKSHVEKDSAAFVRIMFVRRCNG